MSERLVRRPVIPDVIQWHVRRLIAWPALISLLSAPQRTLHSFILVGALLVPELASCRSVTVSLNPVAPSAAAARAEEPEEARGEGEGDADPHRDVNVVAEGAVDVVFRQRVVEGARQRGVEDRGREGEGEEEEGADGRDDGRREATEAGEKRQDADEDLGDGADERDEVGDEHPFRNDPIRVQAVTELFTEQLVNAGVIETPYVDRIEPELVRVWRAVGDVVGHAPTAVRLKVSGAVIPQADMVKIFDVKRRFGHGGRKVEKAVCYRVGGEVQG